MRKYTAAPKEIADALKGSVPVSESAALGDDWKKLPVGAGTRAKADKGVSTGSARHAAATKKAVAYHRTAIKVKAAADVVEVNVGDMRVKLQGAPSASYARGLAKAVRDYIKKHPVKA